MPKPCTNCQQCGIPLNEHIPSGKGPKICPPGLLKKVVKLARDNSHGLGFAIDPISGQVIGQAAIYGLDALDKFKPSGELNPFSIKFGDSANMDGNSRLRIAQPVNLFLNKNIHTFNDTLWEEVISGAIIVHGTVTGGPFQVGEIFTGGTSGHSGTITTVNAGSIIYDVNHNHFTDGETITGGTSGATATVTTHDTGSNVSHDRDVASTIIQTGATAGDSAVRQSHRYVPYVPGKNQHITITFLFGASVDGLTRRAGYYNGDNGLYLEQKSAAVRVVRRTKTSGVVVDEANAVEQADWNIDKLDGTGNSGITLDLSKTQFFVIDFVWQGVGRLRWGFELGGRIIYFHQETFTNDSVVPFMSTPTLPIKFEALNVGGTGSTHTVKEICTSVVSEGGEKLTGLGFAVSNDIVARALTTTETPVIAIRLKATFGGGDNRKTVEISGGEFFTVGNGDTHWELKHVHAPSAITATWQSVSDESAVEFSTDISAISGTPAHSIREGYASAGVGGSGLFPAIIGVDKEDQHKFLSQNFDSTNSQVFVLVGRTLAGALDGYGVLSWIEYE